MKRITYAIERDTGFVYSRVASEIAVPVMQYDQIGQNGDFSAPIAYKLERFPVLSLADSWQTLKWTRKIPVEIKNRHRDFWGLKPLAT